MRGGALVPLIWALLLAVLGTINAIWTQGNIIQGGSFAGAIGSIVALAVLLAALSPKAVRRGPPELTGEPETVPSASVAAMVAGLAVGAFVFGFAFGHFALYFGAGLLLVALARLAVEIGAERRTRERWRREWPAGTARPAGDGSGEESRE